MHERKRFQSAFASDAGHNGRRTNADAICNAHANRVTNTDAYGHSDANTDGYSDTDADGHSDAYTNGYSDTDTHRHSDANAYGYSHPRDAWSIPAAGRSGGAVRPETQFGDPL